MDYKKILASLAISTTVMLSVAGCLYQGTTVKNVDTSKTVITTQQKSTQEVLETSNTQQALKQGTVAYTEFANSILDALGKGGGLSPTERVNYYLQKGYMQPQTLASNITRLDAAVIIANELGVNTNLVPKTADNGFNDTLTLPIDKQILIATVFNEKIMIPMKDGSLVKEFRPNEYLTQQEFIEILTNLKMWKQNPILYVNQTNAQLGLTGKSIVQIAQEQAEAEKQKQQEVQQQTTNRQTTNQQTTNQQINQQQTNQQQTKPSTSISTQQPTKQTSNTNKSTSSTSTSSRSNTSSSSSSSNSSSSSSSSQKQTNYMRMYIGGIGYMNIDVSDVGVINGKVYVKVHDDTGHPFTGRVSYAVGSNFDKRAFILTVGGPRTRAKFVDLDRDTYYDALRRAGLNVDAMMKEEERGSDWYWGSRTLKYGFYKIGDATASGSAYIESLSSCESFYRLATCSVEAIDTPDGYANAYNNILLFCKSLGMGEITAKEIMKAFKANDGATSHIVINVEGKTVLVNGGEVIVFK